MSRLSLWVRAPLDSFNTAIRALKELCSRRHHEASVEPDRQASAKLRAEGDSLAAEAKELEQAVIAAQDDPPEIPRKDS